MATFTITTPVNIDSLVSKTGGDAYNINGGVLTIDQDTRYGLNQNTSASMGLFTMSATLGGTVEVDARFVRLIPYNTGTGNVPVENTVITQGSASGKMIGVYSALNAAPTAVGAAMPASGYIKVKAWNSVSYSAGALSGIGATATGADTVGWIELVGDEISGVTVNRLNLWRMRGEWMEIGTTSGSSASTYQIPTNGSNMYLPGVYVETGTGTGVYEFYPCAGTLTALLANVATNAIQGKFCWVSTAGLLRFQNDGTNSTGGYLPPSGRKIRIPNIITQNATTAARTVNALPNVTLASRYEFVATGGGVLSFDKVNLNWFPSFVQAFSVDMHNCSIDTQVLVSEIASPMNWTNVNVGQVGSASQFPFSMTFCLEGGSFTDCNFTRTNLASSGFYIMNILDCADFTFTRVKTRSLTNLRGNSSTGAAQLTRCSRFDFVDCELACGRTIMTTCVDIEFTNTGYFDGIATTTTTTMPMYMFELSSATLNIVIDGIHFNNLPMVQPYAGVLLLSAAGCAETYLRNIGSYASPLDMGSPRVDNAAWTRVTTVATVTSVAHGLKVGDIVYAVQSSAVAAIIVGAKTITTVPTANTFTFACLNAGAASGTISYYGTMSGSLFAINSNAGANGMYVQRCYVPHTRVNLCSADNSSKNVVIDNVYGDWVNAPAFPQVNGIQRGLGCTPSLAAQTGCYGTHWFDNFMSDPTPNVTAQAWTRVTTTATVTSTGHNLRTGMQIIVMASSSTAAVILGVKTLTVLDANTFTFTCLNAGSASGTLDFVPLNSRIGILCNEASTATTENYTIDAGAPVFTSSGSMYMPTIGDQITFETPYYVIGHTGFPITEAVLSGTIGNYDITYALDKNDGAGYGSFKNLAYNRAGGSGTNGASTISVTDATGVAVGDYVYGTNVGPNTKVLSIASNTLTVDNSNIGTVSGVLRFSQLPNETGIDAEKGFKMKIRLRTRTTNTAAILSLYVFTNSDATSRAYQYPLDLATLTLTGLQPGSDIVVLQPGTSTEYNNTDANVGTTFTYTYDTETVTAVDVAVYKAGYVPFFVRNFPLTVAGASLPIVQIADRAYM